MEEAKNPELSEKRAIIEQNGVYMVYLDLVTLKVILGLFGAFAIFRNWVRDKR